MKRKILKIIMLIMLPCILIMGCNKKQITINQIYEALSNNKDKFVDDVDSLKIGYGYGKCDEYKILWENKFEGDNIDTTNLTTVAYMLIYNDSFDINIEIKVFRFTNTKSAKKVYEKYDFSKDELSAKQYGNLVVAAVKDHDSKVFSIIDKIK